MHRYFNGFGSSDIAISNDILSGFQGHAKSYGFGVHRNLHVADKLAGAAYILLFCC